MIVLPAEFISNLDSTTDRLAASVISSFFYLCRRLFEPQQNLLTVPQTQVSPLRETPNSSPVHNQNPSKPEAYTDPLVRRRPRISHLSKKTATDLPRVAKHVTRTEAMEATLDPRRLFSPLEGPRPKSDQPPSPVRGKRPKRKRNSEQVGKVPSFTHFRCDVCVTWGLSCLKGDRRTDEDGRKRDQCSDRTNGAASADCTGQNHDVINEETATSQHFTQHRRLLLS